MLFDVSIARMRLKISPMLLQLYEQLIFVGSKKRTLLLEVEQIIIQFGHNSLFVPASHFYFDSGDQLKASYHC